MTVCFRCSVCCGDRVAASCGLGQAPSEQLGNRVHSHVDTGNVNANCTCEYCDSICDVGREEGEQVSTGIAFVT